VDNTVPQYGFAKKVNYRPGRRSVTVFRNSRENRLKADPLIACPDCDALQREVSLPAGRTASCVRCGTPLYHSAGGGLSHALAFTLAAMVLFVAANMLPIAGLDLGTADSEATLPGAVLAMYERGQVAVAGVIAFTALVAPAVELFAMAYMLLPLSLGACPRHLSLVFRIVPIARTWALVDVFMLAVVVALIKLEDLATVYPGGALGPYAALIVLVTLVGIAFDPREIWLHAQSCRAAAEREKTA
jgi:paraquat-inducible protein A